MLTDYTGKELDSAPRGLKLRLASVYRNPGQTMVEIMAEIATLSDKDKADFAGWFTSAGYPIIA